MPGVGGTVGMAVAASWDAGAVAASGCPGACAKPAAGAVFGWAAAGALAAGALAGDCAAAGVSPAAAKAIAHPMYFISTPEVVLEPETQDCAAGVGRSIGAGFRSLKRLIQHPRGGVEGLSATA